MRLFIDLLLLPRPRLCSNIEEDAEEAKLPVNMGSFLPDKVVLGNILA